ncbi:hypothetical protein BGX34_003265 [Mortierella sp. NVP85]|nr:hypothetical protein BGX34_003265 [Mortierella sp. NVP85]
MSSNHSATRPLSATASSSASGTLAPHNPYPTGHRPLDSSNFLPEEPLPGGPLRHSQLYGVGDDDDDDDDDDEDEDGEDDDDSNLSDETMDDIELVGTSAEPSALIQPAPDPMPEPHIITGPISTTAFSFGVQTEITPKLLHQVLMSPVPQGSKFHCRIERKNDGMDKRIYPTYELRLEEPSERRIFLLRATKRKRSRGSYYAISSEMKDEDCYKYKASDIAFGVLGKLRSNFLGTVFHVYSNGRNPFSGGDSKDDDGLETAPAPNGKGKGKKEDRSQSHLVRQELGAVIYNPNVLGLKGPRKMTILMNTMMGDGSMVEKRPTHNKDTLIGRMTDGDMSDLLVLRNKSPQWNDDTNSFVLNFGGRVHLASVKNFQIVHENDLDYIIMQFGRTSQDSFSMDCQYPMTPFQAFAFALTSFDAKLACE